MNTCGYIYKPLINGSDDERKGNSGGTIRRIIAVIDSIQSNLVPRPTVCLIRVLCICEIKIPCVGGRVESGMTSQVGFNAMCGGNMRDL